MKYVIALVSLSMMVGCQSAEQPTETTVTTEVTVIPVKRVFATSQSFTGNLGGLNGADAKCQAAATTAGLTGTYLAFLSTSTTNAFSRINASNAYYLVDKTTLIFSPLGAGPTASQLQFEDGTAWPIAQFTEIWTATNDDGTTNLNTCNDWTSNNAVDHGAVAEGNPGTLATKWLFDEEDELCSNANRLYCFEE